MSNTYKGIVFLFTSALFFTLTTVVVKIASNSYLIPSVQLSFARFAFGLIMTIAYILISRKQVKPNNYSILYIRGFLNSIAVIFFFIGVSKAGVSRANILNMTYPVFVALFAPLLINEKISLVSGVASIIAIIGVFFVSGGNFSYENLSSGDLYSLGSALFASFAIIALRKARKTEESHVILLYLMVIGTIASGVFFYSNFIFPTTFQFFLICLVGIFSFIGQLSITYGYKYIDALSGSIISTSRIFLASFIGTFILNEIFTLKTALGGLLIFTAILSVSIFNTKK
jgi:drug/metabolite transporter (DMT)-like permease